MVFFINTNLLEELIKRHKRQTVCLLQGYLGWSKVLSIVLGMFDYVSAVGSCTSTVLLNENYQEDHD